MKKQNTKWPALSADALRKATQKYDAEFAADAESKPLNAMQRQLHLKAKRVGRPRQGKGSQVVSVSVEKSLLKQADAYAKRQGLGRSELFILGLKELLVSK
jgi:hypothetical protein